jgi:ribosomal-protein-alanine N-acetyltransferase
MPPDRSSASLPVIATPRLVLRPLTGDDAAFIFELVTDPAWLRFIGDKGVANADDARRYIENGPAAMYARHGFGLYAVELKEDGVPIGMCGLIKRDTLPDVDLGFAFLPRYRSQGYGVEAGAAMLDYGRNVLRLERIVAIVSPDNTASISLLKRLGFACERSIAMGDDAVALYKLGPVAATEGASHSQSTVSEDRS